MGVKVAYNACYGRFSLSRAATELLNQRKGSQVADPDYGFIECGRHDTDLIAVIEELGEDAASGAYSKIVVREIEGNLYRVTEYDGYESIETPDSTDWVCAV